MSGKQLTLLILAIAVLLVATNTLFTVDEREKVVLIRLGKIHTVHNEPGLKVKLPMADTVKKFDARILPLDNKPERFLTVEKKNLDVDYFVRWRIQDAERYYLATQGIEATALQRLSKTIKDGLKGEFARRTVQEAVSGERAEIMRLLQDTANAKMAEFGIEVIDVRIKRIDFNPTVVGSVYDRMRAERVRDANEIRAEGAKEAEKIRAEADRKREVILAEAYREAEQLRGDGDATSADVYAQAYDRDREFYSFWRSLSVYEQAWQHPDDLLVLEPEGEFFRYFNPDSR